MWKEYGKKRENSRQRTTKVDSRKMWHTRWSYVQYLKCVLGGNGAKGEGAGGTFDGDNRRQRKKFRPPWKESSGRLRRGGAGEKTSCIRIQKGEGGRVGW